MPSVLSRKPFACCNPRLGCWQAAQGPTLWELKPGGKWEKLGWIPPTSPGHYAVEYGQLLPSGECHYFRSKNVPSCDAQIKMARTEP